MTESGPLHCRGSQSIDEDDIAAVESVLRSEWLTTGPHVDAFERELAEYVGVRHAVVVNSGTAALHAAYYAAEVGPGDSIVTSPLTFVATAHVARHLGATVRFADVDRRTGNLDPAAAEAAMGPGVRALVGIDFAGHPADATKLSALAGRHGARWIVDGAHSLGARRGGQAAGALADATTTSFHPVKAITCGEGGALLSDDEGWAQRAARFRNHGVVRERACFELFSSDSEPPAWHYESQDLGLNYRLPDLLCALGRSQLRRLDRFIARRRTIASLYSRELATTPGIELPLVESGVEASWHLYVIRVREATRRRAFFEALSKRGLGVQVHYYPVHLQPYYRRLGGAPGQFPNAEDFAARAISIPLFPRLSDTEAGKIIEIVDESARATL